MEKKRKLDAPLWVRISKINRDWIDDQCKKLGYSRSDFVNTLLSKQHSESLKAKK